MDGTLAEPHAALGLALTHNWEWSSAETEFKRAIELKPDYPTAYHWYATLLSSQGRHSEALAAIKKGRELDPLSPIMQVNVGLVFHRARQYEQAIEELRKGLELDPNFPQARAALSAVYLMKGMFAEAIAEAEKALALSRGESEIVSLVACSYARVGRRADAEKLLNKVKRNKYVPPVYVALIYEFLGDKEQAFAWLETACDEHAHDTIVLGVDAAFDGLRSDPRFANLLRRMGLQ